MNYIFFVLLYLLTTESTNAVPFNKRPLAVTQPIGDALMIPFSTVLPTQGDRAISGNKMLASMGSYLRGYHHYLYQPRTTRTFAFKQEGNCEASGADRIEKVHELMHKSPLFIGFIGTELFLSLQKKLEHQELMLLFPLEGLEDLRKPNYRNVIYFRPSHTKELEALIAYAVKERHRTSIGLFYEESLWGEKLLAKAQEILKTYADVKIVAQASYPQGTVEIEKAIDKIAGQAPNVVLCLARARPAYTFIRHALDRKLHETLFLGMSELNTIQSILRSALGMNIVVTSVVPHPEQHASLPLMQEYKRVMESFLSSNADSPIYLESFINLTLTEHCCRDILTRGIALTPDALINRLEQMRHETIQGLTLNFDPTDRSLSRALWINPGIGQPWVSYENIGLPTPAATAATTSTRRTATP